MILVFLQFIGMLLSGIAAGVVFSHVLQKPGKMMLSAEMYVVVQNRLYQPYKWTLGIVEVGALVCTSLVAGLVPHHGADFYLIMTAALCLLLMLLIWAIGIQPINLKVSRWTAASYPPNWTELRDQWHFLHAIRSALAVMALALQIVAAVGQ